MVPQLFFLTRRISFSAESLAEVSYQKNTLFWSYFVLCILVKLKQCSGICILSQKDSKHTAFLFHKRTRTQVAEHKFKICFIN